jgi:hypothetical protein
MPTVVDTEEKFVGLFAIYDAPENFVAIYAEGDYVVDWGDGTVENIPSGQTAEHSYTWANIPADTLTTEGYRQVVVTVVPQEGNNLTVLDLSVRHDNMPGSGNDSNAPWLDLAISLPLAQPGAPIRFNWDSPEAEGGGYLFSAQRIHIIHAGQMDDFSWAMNYSPSLRYVKISNSPYAETLNNMLNQCGSLTDLYLEDTSSVTDIYSMCYGCYSLQNVGEMDLSAVEFANWAFSSCTSLQSLPPFNLPVVGHIAYMLSNCQSLISAPSITAPLVESCSGLFNNCYSLNSVPTLNFSSVTDASGVFTRSPSLQQAFIEGITVDISFQECCLGRGAIVDIFTALGETEGATVNVQGNYGAADLTPEDIAIAVDKGWTVLS